MTRIALAAALSLGLTAPAMAQHTDHVMPQAPAAKLGASRTNRAASPHFPGVAAPIVQEPAMLHYAVVFFVIALIAALFGFGGIAASAMGIGKILFVVFAVLAVASFLIGLVRKS